MTMFTMNGVVLRVSAKRFVLAHFQKSKCSEFVIYYKNLDEKLLGHFVSVSGNLEVYKKRIFLFAKEVIDCGVR